MAGKRYSKDEISQVQALIGEGLTNKEIATQLGRSEAGIRNIKYRQRLKNKAENETRILLQQRDQLRFQVPELQRKHTELVNAIDIQEKRKSRVEELLKLDRSLLRLALTQSITRLKQERLDLFVMSEKEQINTLVTLFLKRLLS